MIRVAVLTISDSAVEGRRADLSGPALCAECLALGWEVTATATMPDETGQIAGQIRAWIDIVDLILTTGGTGVSERDVTPEATREVIERELPGLAELMRAKGLEQTQFAPLSRAVVGTARETLVVNTPGSPTGAVHSLRAIAHLVPHVVQLLHGNTGHTGLEASTGRDSAPPDKRET